MSEPEYELTEEDRMEKAGYFDWKVNNLGDMKEDFLMQTEKKYLIQHFYWDEKSLEEFFDEHEEEFNKYIDESWNGHCDVEDTDNHLVRQP